MHYIKVIIAIGIILALGGCGGTVGKNFKISKVENIVTNTTTQMEIKNMFGKPFKTGIQNGQPIWIYEYNRYHLLANGASKDLVIIFGPNGVVQSHQFMSSEPTP